MNPKPKLQIQMKKKKMLLPSIINQQGTNEEYNFNFSDEEIKEEEESPDIITMKEEMKRKPKSIYTINSDFPDDDQMVDIGSSSPQQQTNDQEVDQDLFNDLLGESDKNNNELDKEEDKNESQQKQNDNNKFFFEEEENGKEDDQIYSEKIEFKENVNDDENIFHFSDENNEEDEEEDSPDVAALKVDMTTPKKRFDIRSDFPDDDLMIDFGGDDPIETDQ